MDGLLCNSASGYQSICAVMRVCTQCVERVRKATSRECVVSVGVGNYQVCGVQKFVKIKKLKI